MVIKSKLPILGVAVLLVASAGTWYYYISCCAPLKFDSNHWKSISTEARARMIDDLWRHEGDFKGLTKSQIREILGQENSSQRNSEAEDFGYLVGRGGLYVHFNKQGKSTGIEPLAQD